MKLLLGILLLCLLTGCQRYQLVSGNEKNAWRIDTWTGKVAYCDIGINAIRPVGCSEASGLSPQ